MSAVDEHAEAHRLKAELGWGARRIAGRLGISRYAAEQLLARPLPALLAEAAGPSGEPVADVAGREQPVAEAAADVADRSAGPVGRGRPVAEPVAEVAQPVAVRVADEARPVAALVFRPVAAAPSAPPVPWLQVDLGGRPWLLRELRRLAWWGLRIPSVVDLAVRSFAVAYHQAITTGRLQPGQAYEVQTLIRPLQHGAAT